MALLVLAARLTGGRDQGGRVVVQTRSADHRVLRAAVRADPGRFAAEERDLRRSMGLPPFGALAEISGAGAGELVAPLGRQPGVTVLGPRHDGRYLLRAGGPEALAAVLARAARPAARVRVAVDPPRA
jgi:primosomal protein N' (replication factor Y)